MRVCKTCGDKFSLKQNLKSSYKRDGKIECKKCNSIFVLKKENALRWMLDFILICILISISEKIGGIKGIIITLVIGAIGVFINLNLDNRYMLKNDRQI